MASVYGEKIKVSLFGESHGKAVGCVIDGLPAGLSLDTSFIERRLRERQNGAIYLKPYSRPLPPDSHLSDSRLSVKGKKSDEVHPRDIGLTDAASSDFFDIGLTDAVSIDFSSVLTPRTESIRYTVLGGLSGEGVCLGSPLAVYFENRDVGRKDYDKLHAVYRPGHADYVSAMRSGGFADLSGGGHFSGRLTAPLVFAGAICEQLLAQKGVFISATVERIGEVDLTDSEGISCSAPDSGSGSDSPAVESKFGLLTELFRKLDEMHDSVGCKIGVKIDGVPLGIGAPFFDTLEGEIAKVVLAVPGVKGIEFGAGFEFALKYGSEAVDAFVISREDGVETPKIVTDHNHNGGINGGISNGMPIVFSVAVKPASSIGIPIRTLNFETMREDVLVTGGRHDRCIGLRAMAGVAAAAAIAIINQI